MSVHDLVEGGMSLRVYGGDAIMAPGVAYKSVLVSPDMSSLEVRGYKNHIVYHHHSLPLINAHLSR